MCTALNNFKKDMPGVVSPNDCAKGSLSELENRQKVGGAFFHSLQLMLMKPMLGLDIPYLGKNSAKMFENDRDIVMAPHSDSDRK